MVVHALLGVFVAYPDVNQQRGYRVEIYFCKSGIGLAQGIVLAPQLVTAGHGNGAVLDVGKIQVGVCVVDVFYHRLSQVVQVIIEVGTHEITGFPFVSRTYTDAVALAKFIGSLQIAYRLVFRQFSEITHGLLFVQGKQAQSSGFLIVTEHHLPAVGLVTCRLAV